MRYLTQFKRLKPGDVYADFPQGELENLRLDMESPNAVFLPTGITFTEDSEKFVYVERGEEGENPNRGEEGENPNVQR